MGPNRLLVANRGEIAVRILRAGAELGLHTVAVYSEDDARAMHVGLAAESVGLGLSGPPAYLDRDRLVGAAVDAGCDLLHPGYGFLSEDPALARACAEAGVTFVGPSPETLELFGDKARGRALAAAEEVPVLDGSDGPVTLEQAGAFLAGLGPGGAMMVKAVAGGGGRGMRIVRDASELDEAYRRCRSEAGSAFGRDDVLVERWLPDARHIEVQLVGDGSGDVVALGERDCTLQRRYQKLIELAPCPWLDDGQRDAIIQAAVRMGRAARLASLATFEFLWAGGRFAFIEANPRLQVEHPVTEEVTGIDLVKTQLRLAGGAPLASLGLAGARPRGVAIEARVNLESMAADGAVVPSGGTLAAFDLPAGPGVRVDTFGYCGYTTSPRFDSLLAKVIVRGADLDEARARAEVALSQLRAAGVQTNVGFLRAALAHPDLAAGRIHTGWIESHAGELVAAAPAQAGRGLPAGEPGPPGRAGALVDSVDPLAVLDHGRSAPGGHGSRPSAGGPVAGGALAIPAPVQGTVVSVDVAEGETVAAGAQLVVMEAMKMEHVVAAPFGAAIQAVNVERGDTILAGHPLLYVEASGDAGPAGTDAGEVDLDHIRPDLAAVHQRHRFGDDDARPDAVARRRRTGQRTARENVADLVDPGSLVEYGPLVIAAQRRRRPVEELIERTPADGLIAGIGTVNGALFGAEAARCAVMSYDYTVLAGTQGLQNHRKKDRLFELAERLRLPVVFFTEGGGGRPGDTDGTGVAGLDCMAFHLFGRLSGTVPLVGIASGRCFAGNAALLGCCDVVIATANANIGMGGPAMVEGGGLGVFRPEEIGPLSVQVANGVVDIPVADEAEAVRVARRYLSYFQGTVDGWECADQRRLRSIIPENRLRVYDVRQVIDGLADTGSVLELRRGFGAGMVTALARIEGRPIGVVANNPVHLAGAIDSDGADKAARFLQLCDAFGLPVLFLCDTPGIMVGPEAEKTALVRHCSRLFVTGASLRVPFFTIVLRKAYGLGAQAMAGGSFKAPVFTVSWPTGEFGGMGLEGAVKLGYRNELAAIEDPVERRATFEEMVARSYEHGQALNTASHFEIDEVIDPVDSRHWISRALRSVPPRPAGVEARRPCVDTW